MSSSRGSWLNKQRANLRTQRNRLVNQQLLTLKRARREIIDGTDVLLFSDSTVLWGHPGDEDSAMLPELLSRELGGARVTTFAGPGFGPRMYSEALRVLATLDERPKYLVFSAALRTVATMIHDHPVYRYPRSIERLQGITSARRRLPVLGGEAATPEDYAAFKALPIRSRWAGETTIGEYRSRLEGQGPRPWPRELERLHFDYFHGEEIRPDHPGMEDCRDLGRRVKEYGVPAVSYTPLAPLERGELNFPGEFADFVTAKQDAMERAIAEYAGEWQLVDSGFTDEDYIDSQDATEHFALSGRLKIARSVSQALLG